MKIIIQKVAFFSLIATLCMAFFGCQKDDDKDRSINIFTIEDDKMLGKQLADEIAADPQMYPVLDEDEYKKAYEHLYRIRDEILEADAINYKDVFDWQTKIVHNDTILNAFAGPAGYIYVYTGLIKFLESEDHFAGVLAHEIAHADRRHVTDQLSTNLGLEVILSIILGNEDPSTIAEIGTALAGLTFTRAKEKEADEFSVKYLCNTEWNANGAGGFFQRLIEMGQAIGLPEFLSTHPNPDNRVEAINEQDSLLMCPQGKAFVDRYEDFKKSLP